MMMMMCSLSFIFFSALCSGSVGSYGTVFSSSRHTTHPVRGERRCVSLFCLPGAFFFVLLRGAAAQRRRPDCPSATKNTETREERVGWTWTKHNIILFYPQRNNERTTTHHPLHSNLLLPSSIYLLRRFPSLANYLHTNASPYRQCFH